MVPEKTVQLVDERVSWKVPTLFDNDWVGLSLARALNPLLPKPLFSTAYGCPACAWAGGRHAWVREELTEAQLRRYFEAYRMVGAVCALTFTRPDAGAYADDRYSNLLLALADEYGGQVIVVDDALARYIRKTCPNVGLVVSNNRCLLDYAQGFGGLSEERYYRQLLDLYDEIVVRCEVGLEGGVADQMADIADHIEIIVNQRCVVNCPDAPTHIMSLARIIKDEAAGGKFVHYGCTQPNRGIRNTVVIEPERRQALADMGFTKFKLQGRNAAATSVFKNLVNNILEDGEDLYTHEALIPIVEEALALDVTRYYHAEALTRIPD